MAIPKLPLLARTPVRSGNGHSFYYRDSLFLRLGTADEVKLGDSREHSGANQLAHQSMKYGTALIHEWTHWNQHHGTSVGIFLDCLRQSQSQTVVRWIRELPKAARRKIVDQRMKSNIPLIRLSGERQSIEHVGDDAELDLLRQIWYDHQLTFMLLDDASIARNVNPLPSEVFGQIVSDVALSIGESKEFIFSGDDDIEGVRRAFGNGGDELAFVEFAGETLSTRLLMEAMATAAEYDYASQNLLWVIADRGAGERWSRAWLESASNSSYGLPLRIALHRLHPDMGDLAVRNLDAVLATLQVVCYVALNPPLPPFDCAPPPRRSEWDWSEIYPPLRFIRLIDACKSLGLMYESASRANVCRYIIDLCDAAGLPNILSMRLPDLNLSDRAINFGAWGSRSEGFPKFTRSQYVSWVQGEFSKIRGRDIPILTHIGRCFNGPDASEHTEFAFHLDVNRVPFFHCPLNWSSSGVTESRGGREFASTLSMACGLEYAMFDFAVGVGEFSLNDAFPPDIASSVAVQTVVRNSVVHNLVEVDNLSGF